MPVVGVGCGRSVRDDSCGRAAENWEGYFVSMFPKKHLDNEERCAPHMSSMAAACARTSVQRLSGITQIRLKIQ